ncbi:MAG: sodium/hydrogen exchanger [Bryobacterales bacterium]|nr:sodium/hydrogen exchanger [Bryobacterales bacterium]
MPVESPLTIPLSLLIIFGVAKLMAEIFERLRLPGIVGEIVAGVLVGPQVLHWLEPNTILSAFSDLGLIFLLFRVGLEVRPSSFRRAGKLASLVAVCGVILPFLTGAGIMLLWRASFVESCFIGVAMVATSVGITAKALAEQGALHMPAAQVILAAAVYDDILGLLALALVTSFARGAVRPFELLFTAVVAIGFTMLTLHWGTPVMQRILRHLSPRLRISETEFALAMVVLFALSVLAVFAGVAPIVGAFLAGMAMSESVERRVHDMTGGVTEVFLPFFLAGIGMRLDLAIFRDTSTLLLASLIIAGAIVSKLAGCGLGALSMGRTDALRVGVGMIPRGEVGMVVAQIGAAMGVIPHNLYGIVVAMSVVTTLAAPPLLRAVFPRKHPD